MERPILKPNGTSGCWLLHNHTIPEQPALGEKLNRRQCSPLPALNPDSEHLHSTVFHELGSREERESGQNRTTHDGSPERRHIEHMRNTPNETYAANGPRLTWLRTSSKIQIWLHVREAVCIVGNFAPGR